MRKTLLYCVLFFSFVLVLIACGKEEKLEGNKYKAYVNGRLEAELMFQENEVKITVPNKLLGESLVKYEIKDSKDKKYLFIKEQHITDIFKNSLTDLGNPNSNVGDGSIYVWRIDKGKNEIFLKPVLVKTKEGYEDAYNENLNLSNVLLDKDHESENEIRLKIE